MNARSTFAIALLALLAGFQPALRAQEEASPEADAATGPPLEALGEAFAILPVQHQGRVKPFDTFARAHLLLFRGKSTADELSARAWLAELLLFPRQAYDRKVFLIRNDEVLQAFSLEKDDDHVYSFMEIIDGVEANSAMLTGLLGKEDKERSRAEKQLVELYQKAMLYLDLSRSLTGLKPLVNLGSERLARELGLEGRQRIAYREAVERRSRLTELFDQSVAGEGGESGSQSGPFDEAVQRLAMQLAALARDSGSNSLPAVMPETDQKNRVWSSPWQLLDGRTLGAWERDRLVELERLVALARQGRVEEAAAQARSYARNLDFDAKLGLELDFNRADFFYRSLYFYVAAALLLGASFFGWRTWLYRAGFALFAIGLALLATGIVYRMIIMGRPPVTTLYESVIFVNFVICLGGFALELFRRDRLGLFLACAAGIVLHFIGFRYAAEGDTMGMLVAVLRSNFWLATHVVTITIGYGAAFVAGLVAHAYLAMRVFRPQARKQARGVYNNAVGLSIVALFFTTLGTILGGIWADQSWGRFWGWDPKENGALLIVLWLLICLHGRVSGILKDGSYAAMLSLVNITVALAWFGVNLLSVGLHNYGFDDGVATNLFLYCLAELLFVGVFYGLIRYQGRRPKPAH